MNPYTALHPVIAVTAITVILTFGCGRPENAVPTDRTVSDPALTPAVAPEPLPGPEFLAAAHDGKLEEVRAAIKNGTPVNWVDERGQTALMLSAFNGHAEIVKLLLDGGAKVELRDGTGRTALMFASTFDSTDAVGLLLAKGSDVNAVDSGEKWTALMFAAAEGHQGVVVQLLEHGANPRTLDVDGDDAAAFAVQRGHRDLARMLQEAGQKD